MTVASLQESTPWLSRCVGLGSLFIHECVLILRKAFAYGPPVPPEKYHVVRDVSVQPEVIRLLYLGFGHDRSLSKDGLEGRYAHGLRFFDSRERNESRATTWVVPREESASCTG